MKCSCGAGAYSLNPAEVVVHRTDGPCTIEPALRATIAAWNFDHEREERKAWVDNKWQYRCRCGATFATLDAIYWHRIDALSSILTAGVNDGPVLHLPADGADDAPDELKGGAAWPPASHSAPAVTAYCYADCGGALRHWTRPDGRRGFTCEKCGRTA